MNPAEIYDALAALAAKPYDPVEFPFDFALATDNTPATVAKLKGGTFNKSDLPGGVLMNQKFHFAPALTGMAVHQLDLSGPVGWGSLAIRSDRRGGNWVRPHIVQVAK